MKPTKILRLLLVISLLVMTLPAMSQRKKAKAKSPQPKVVVDPLQQLYDAYSSEPILNVMVVDSIATSLNQVVDVINLPSYAGKLLLVDGRFVYENEMGDMQLYDEVDPEGNLRIYQIFQYGEFWSYPEPLKIDSDLADMARPWLMSDGQTLYFSGRTSEPNDSTFSLYMSTLNTDTGEFMRPQRLPMPLSSSFANDYFYIENDVDSVAWLVTSRGLEDKVNVYTLRPHNPWQFYETDDMSVAKLVSLAELRDISDTWPSAEARAEEKQRMESLALNVKKGDEKAVLFVLDDTRVVTDASQLSSATSKALLRRYNELNEQLTQTVRQQEEFRLMYSKTTPSNRQKTASAILEMEQKERQLREQITAVSKELRSKEL